MDHPSAFLFVHMIAEYNMLRASILPLRPFRRLPVVAVQRLLMASYMLTLCAYSAPSHMAS
eukprot:768022-Hanusia_phi.AAC.2